MPERLTDDKLTEIRERHSAATPGPWAWDWDDAHYRLLAGDFCVLDAHEDEPIRRDAQFIQHSWQDVADLLADNERLKDELYIAREAAREMLRDWHCWNPPLARKYMAKWSWLTEEAKE